MATTAPQYAVQRASDASTAAKATPARNANLMGDSSSGDAEADLEAIINAELPDALQFIDTEMGQKRAKATEYYMGEPFGNEEIGRSKVVSRDVLAAVQALMPSIMRTFFGGRRRVRYRPVTAADVAAAEQATEFVNKVVMQVDNDGFLEIFAASKDALVRYKGLVKWWWDDAREVTTDTYTGLDEDGVMLLANDPEVEDLRVYEEDGPINEPKTYSAVAKRVVKHVGKARFGCVPPEEVLVCRDARDIKTARFLDHRRVMLTGELTALGYDLDDLLPHTSARIFNWSPEVAARAPSGTSIVPFNGSESGNELQQPVTYHEAYLRADMDGDDYPELIKACGVGDGANFKLLHWEPVSEIPFAAFDPDPEPHTFFGLAPGPNVMDVQLIKSDLMRMQLDGAALALDPRLEVVEHMVELDDLLNPDISQIVRTRAPGQIAPIRYDFNPQATMGLLEYMDQVREERSRSSSRASQGLDADALQSSTKMAVASVLSGSQQQQELICRLFGEGMRQLFAGILRLLHRHQDQERMVLLRGEWVAVDPRSWNAEMDVEIEVGVGVGGVEMEIAALQERKLTQEGILQLYGPDNPMVTVAQYRDTLAKLDELRGLPDSDTAYNPVPKDWKPPAPPPQKSDAEILQETAMAELKLKEQQALAEIELKWSIAQMEDARQREKDLLDFRAKIAEIEAKRGNVIDEAKIIAETDRHIAEHEAEAEKFRAVTEATAQLAAGPAPSAGATDG